MILFLGNEAQGIPAKIKSELDYLIGIKKRGEGDSLNLAVAAGILLNELLKER